MNIDAIQLGTAIKKVRVARQLTQLVVAERLGVTTNYLSLLENGKRGISIPHLNELAIILDVPAAFLAFLGSSPNGPGRSAKLMKQIQKMIGAVVALESELSASGS